MSLDMPKKQGGFLRLQQVRRYLRDFARTDG